MITAFQKNAFQNNAFQIEAATVTATGGVSGGRRRPRLVEERPRKRPLILSIPALAIGSTVVARTSLVPGAASGTSQAKGAVVATVKAIQPGLAVGASITKGDLVAITKTIEPGIAKFTFDFVLLDNDLMLAA